MTRKQRIVLVSCAIALAAASVGGLRALDEGRTVASALMLAAAAVGWIVLVVRLRQLREGV